MTCIAIAKMWPTATDVALSVVYVSVCVLGTLVSPVEAAEPMQVPFGQTHVDPRN